MTAELLPNSTTSSTLKKYNVDRYKIKQILRQHNKKEKHYCDIIERSFQCYWDRFDKATWNAETIYALCYVLSIISNDIITPKMVLETK